MKIKNYTDDVQYLKSKDSVSIEAIETYSNDDIKTVAPSAAAHM